MANAGDSPVITQRRVIDGLLLDRPHAQPDPRTHRRWRAGAGAPGDQRRRTGRAARDDAMAMR